MAETVAKSTGRSLNTTTLGAFGVSAAIHAIIFLAVGSVVVFESPLVTEFFTSDDIGSYEAKQEMEIEPVLLEEQQPLPEFATVDSVTPEGGNIEDEAATPADLIISSVPAPTTSAFALPRNVGSPSGKLFGRRSSGDGDGIGGRGKAITATIFGKTIQSSSLGVVLDISGSAHAHLDKAIAEIDKSFPSAHMVLVIGCGMSDASNVPSQRNGQGVVPGKPRIHDYRDRDKEDEYNKLKRSVTTQLEDFYKKIGKDRSKDIRKYFEKRDNLYILYGGDIHAANFAFEHLLALNTDTIYWFADFADSIDKKIVEDLTKDLKRNGTKVIAHNFLGKQVRKEAAEMANKTGGSTIELVPGK
jgi:hypothetical protein